MWDLAPHQGENVRIAIIDTGSTAFVIQGHDEFKKHPNSVSITASVPLTKLFEH